MHSLIYSGILLACLLVAGCSRNERPVPAATLAEEVPNIQKSFEKAGTTVKTSAADAVTAIQNNDTPRALAELQALCADPNVTSEQRTAASRAIISVMAQLQKDAQEGNAQAAQVLQMHRARK